MPTSRPAGPPVTLESLAPGRAVHGFSPVSRYAGADGRARGARFAHDRSGFVLDYLAIETAPQAFVYVTTYPTSDRGEPHTQEHLLLGRGNKGRALGNFEHTSLVRSSAFTSRYRTAYHFHTVAGGESFFGVLGRELDALLGADYSDEEIRREVRDFGVGTAQDGSLFLEEKGTVYNEMVRSYEEPGRLAYLELGRMLFGKHPLAFSSGGTPEGIRELTPAIIRAFYAAHYRLDNMGMVLALPRDVPLDAALTELEAVLDRFVPRTPPPEPLLKESELPPFHGAPEGEVVVVPFPHANAEHQGSMRFAWPAVRALPTDERVLLELFVGALGGGEGSRLHAALIDTRTRKLDVGATSVWADVEREPGQVVWAGLQDVRAANATKEQARAVRDLILAELREVAALPDGSPQLRELGERVRARAIEAGRALDKMLDTPPSFGARGTYEAWIDLLTDVQADPGFDKSLVRAKALARARDVAGEAKNPWRERIHAWGLDTPPYAAVAQPNPALRKELDQARTARVARELERLKAAYGVTDDAAALARRKAEIDLATSAIARAEAAVTMPQLTPRPPMTDDDLLTWEDGRYGEVPAIKATVDSMKSVTVGLALRLDGVPEELLPVVALLPSFVSDVGVVKDGVPIPYDEVRDRLRREVLGVGAYASVSFATGRAELVVEGSGNDVDEARRAVSWMKDFLLSPDLRPENLPRIRDVAKQKEVELGDVMAGAEEYWVERVEEAYWRQDQPLLLHAGSFLTRAHDAHRLVWRLSGGGPAFGAFMTKLAAAGHGASRAALAELALGLGEGRAPKGSSAETVRLVAAAGALPAEDRELAVKAGHDLGRLLGELPDESLAGDWAALCGEIAEESGAAAGARGAAQPAAPQAALDDIRRVLGLVRRAPGARMWVVGSRASEDALRPELLALVSALDPAPLQKPVVASSPHVLSRARDRAAEVPDPSLVALVNASTANAALVASASLRPFDDPDPGAVDLFLAANVPSGTGAQSFYKRIWGAGLAYSGYAWASSRYGRYKIYSDRCADLPSLLRFLDGEVGALPAGQAMVEYAAARAFTARVADTYEARARGLAADLAEGFPPARVRAFRERVLREKANPAAAEAVHAAARPAYELLLKGGDAQRAGWTEPLRFIVGPEGQIARTEKWLADATGRPAHITRLYPRDFWFMGTARPPAPHTPPAPRGRGVR